VSFAQAVIYWLKLGFISFGGPAGQISMMHQELVEKRCGISEHRLGDCRISNDRLYFFAACIIKECKFLYKIAFYEK